MCPLLETYFVVDVCRPARKLYNAVLGLEYLQADHTGQVVILGLNDRSNDLSESALPLRYFIRYDINRFLVVPQG